MIVFGNTKGGTGKSTLAVHTAVALLHQGHKIAVIDFDGHQGTLSRYFENRQTFQKSTGKTIPMPLIQMRFSPQDNLEDIKEKVKHLKSQREVDLILADTAGYDSSLSRYAHSLADVLITPMNDSGIDLDLLVNVLPTSAPNQLPLSHYATMVWEQRMQKASQEGGSLEWLIVRNRMHSLYSHNHAQIEKILAALSKRIGFHLAGSMSERVIFRELFSYGLTILDRDSQESSHISARGEILKLTQTILSLLRPQKSSSY